MSGEGCGGKNGNKGAKDALGGAESESGVKGKEGNGGKSFPREGCLVD